MCNYSYKEAESLGTRLPRSERIHVPERDSLSSPLLVQSREVLRLSPTPHTEVAACYPRFSTFQSAHAWYTWLQTLAVWAGQKALHTMECTVKVGWMTLIAVFQLMQKLLLLATVLADPRKHQAAIQNQTKRMSVQKR